MIITAKTEGFFIERKKLCIQKSGVRFFGVYLVLHAIKQTFTDVKRSYFAGKARSKNKQVKGTGLLRLPRSGSQRTAMPTASGFYDSFGYQKP